MKETVKCQHCDRETSLPFKCPFCNGYFCTEHRLPENHACREYWRAVLPRRETPTITIEGEVEGIRSEYFSPLIPRSRARAFRFSPTELRHLALSTLLVMGVGLSVVLQAPRLQKPEISLILAAVFTSVFLLHEVAHKLAAQHYGLWAEFRLVWFGVLLTLLSIVSPLKIISPGAVMISGPMSKETVGKTALAGPLTNIALSIIFGIFTLFSPNPLFQAVAAVGVAINAWIALFNLIPFGIMDGWKVFGWNKTVWTLAFVASIALTIFSVSYVFV